jgi:FAD binding domain/Berberine and berberine like
MTRLESRSEVIEQELPQNEGEKMSAVTSTKIAINARLNDLRARLIGNAYAPEDQGYDEASKAWNLNAEQRPAIVVMAQNASDVLEAVRFARVAQMGVGVMATGHGVGTSCNGGLLVNTSRMRRVNINPISRTAQVEAGALWKDLIPQGEYYGLTGLVGSASHIGIVGYTMGGGFGWLGRRYGLNSSSVTEAEIVTSDGELLRLSDTQNADLFWGLKGGGGNFGIVTSLEFRLYPLQTVYGGAVYYPVEAASEVLTRYAQWSAELPDEMTTAIGFMNIPPRPILPKPLQGKSVIVVKGCYCGQKLEDGEALFKSMREGFGEPIMDTFKELPVAAMDAISTDPVDPMGVIQHAEMLHDLTPEAIDALVRVAGAGSGSPLIMLEVRQLGGALSRSPEQLYPMGSGTARFSINAIGATVTPQMALAVNAHLTRVVEVIRPFQTGEVFLNFMEEDPSEARVRAAYPPEDWKRLVALKDEYDPGNLFRFNRNIPPTSSTVRVGIEGKPQVVAGNVPPLRSDERSSQ